MPLFNKKQATEIIPLYKDDELKQYENLKTQDALDMLANLQRYKGYNYYIANLKEEARKLEYGILNQVHPQTHGKLDDPVDIAEVKGRLIGILFALEYVDTLTQNLKMGKVDTRKGIQDYL